MDYNSMIPELLDRINNLEERVERLEKALKNQETSSQPDFSGKYQALSQYLFHTASDETKLTFEQIEKILGFPLPDSAELYRAFWSNTRTHSAAFGWLQAGFETAEVDLQKKSVVFTRVCSSLREPVPDIEKVWKNIQTCAGLPFETKGRISFTYQMLNEYTLQTSNTSMSLSKSNFSKALQLMPVKGPSGFGQKIQGASYVYALLSDDRIMKK